MEYIKYATDNAIKTLLKLINAIFSSAIYPKPWTINYLKPIYKKGETDDPGNYRGLAIGSALSKLYSFILLQRLEQTVQEKDTLTANQIGFRKGYRTSDHIYLLKTLVTKSIKQKKKLYGAFIDFKKAYDTVNRSTLLNTLSKIGIGKHLMANLCSLYGDVNYSIRLGDHILDPISSNLGLKQGCPLSPLLFNIYINNIAEYLNSKPEKNLIIQDTLINHFLYADDLVLLSETKEGLQDQLNRLNKFAKDKDLTVNTKKSMVMIFNKAGKRLKEQITYDGKELDIVHSFTYLGIDITSSGSFAAGIRELTNKARKAMFSLYKPIIQFQLPFTKIMKLFHTYIEPILLYNVENLATLTDKQVDKCKTNHNHIFDMSLETILTITQLKFLKFALGLHKQSPTLAVLGETAELPLSLKGYNLMLKYWNRTKSLEDDTLVKKAYLENIDMNTNWCQTIQVLNVSLDLHSRPIESKNFPHMAKETIRSKFISHWKTKMNNTSKLKFYAKMKHKFQIEQYLLSPLRFEDRRRISKILCSDHVLQIERGRYTNTNPEDRICQMCDLHNIEDELHFLLHCQAYTEARTTFETKTIEEIKTGKIFDVDPNILAKYLKIALTKRDKETNFHVATIPLDFQGVVLKKGSRPPIPQTQLKIHVSATSLSCMQKTISRGRAPPRNTTTQNTIRVTFLDADGLRLNIGRGNHTPNP